MTAPTPTPTTLSSLALAARLGLDRPSYSATEAFEILGVGKDLGWRLIHSGELKASRIGKQNVRVMAVDLADYLHAHRVVPAALPAPPPPTKKRGRPPGARVKPGTGSGA
jgi:excisionase family DNA binding protein